MAVGGSPILSYLLASGIFLLPEIILELSAQWQYFPLMQIKKGWGNEENVESISESDNCALPLPSSAKWRIFHTALEDPRQPEDEDINGVVWVNWASTVAVGAMSIWQYIVMNTY